MIRLSVDILHGRVALIDQDESFNRMVDGWIGHYVISEQKY